MHNLCVFLLFFSKITFYWKLFSDCCDEFDYQGSIVYLSCFHRSEEFFLRFQAMFSQRLLYAMDNLYRTYQFLDEKLPLTLLQQSYLILMIHSRFLFVFLHYIFLIEILHIQLTLSISNSQGTRKYVRDRESSR